MSDTLPLNGAELRAWRAVIDGSWHLQTRLDDELRADTGLSISDYHVLVLLSEAPQRRLRMGEIASRLVFSPSRLTYQISAMEKRGLVRRQPCPDDRRGSEAVLTDEGLDQLRRAAPGHLTAVRRYLMDDLDEAETEVLTRVFTRLQARLRQTR
ncbi:MarR family winged helix-turn-helix transcriptional regulator [Catenuloplanes atrovinosus]|uniref:DNA-binding MarR family transcriptional regulator n=1 Tax=Catenuloplanes atrovinosus TaxID=137266 RepID=A0AAE3YK80_9ACTN|nr:MarR family transcriptional regulator [Catenuloplanes atrovinosus]MDR7273985.1 DNA-binding MarR family transcriptional regulator [Catenuloplanes atrovinosus]